MTINPEQHAYYQITFLRHAESIGNAQRRMQGQSDFPLTEAGIGQARSLALGWKSENQRFDEIISSPLARTRQTAEIIAETLHVPLSYDPIWMERNNGIFAGVTHDEWEARRERKLIHPYVRVGETGESQWQLYLRAGQAIQQLLQRDVGSYLIVSHGGILNMVMYAILGIAPQAGFHGPRFAFENTGFVSTLYIPERHTWRILRLINPLPAHSV